MTGTDYKTMTTAQIRENFLQFFESKGCKRYPSSSLIPDDPSLLLANAGMNQFKEYYQGIKTMREIGATSCQKCLRTNDIENIGDARHLSFFEMLGNFSFGGYTKAQAIAWAWEFITSPEHLGLPKDRLYVTVFTNDDEACELWQEQGVDLSHISRLGEEDNFWAAGPTGPCGPCSEIYFDQGPEFEGEKPGDDGDRYLEFWNLVFTQFDRQEDGSMPELPHRNIDTGMGLERIAAIMQHQGSNYEGDVLRTLIAVGEKLSNKRYHETAATDKSLRILADHARACTFMIGDGILPGNEGRGYVLRRLLRRAIYHGRLLGIRGEFMRTYTHEVMRLMATSYPQLTEGKDRIDAIVSAEEQRFCATLDAGEALLNKELAQLPSGKPLSGEVAFKLHDTYGFPIDLTCEIAENAQHPTDMDTFNALMEDQKARARAQANRDAWGQANSIWASLSDELSETEFLGYTQNSCDDARVIALVRDGALVSSASCGDVVDVILDKTPFYGERGGQVGDTGTLRCGESVLHVDDTQHQAHILIVHTCTVQKGSIAKGDTVSAQIDVTRRELIRRNHTATHLLQAALKQVLGKHVSQAGSLVAPDRLRFDFTHFEALTRDQIAQVEAIVNREIFAAEPMVTRVVPLAEARKTDAIALFDEMYDADVRIVQTGSSEDAVYSRELCGGTHVRNTADIGYFKIISETSVGSNVRRLEALTSCGAYEYVDAKLSELSQLASMLKCREDDVLARVDQLKSSLSAADKKLKAALSGSSSDQVSSAVSSAYSKPGYKLVIAHVQHVEAKDLRSMWDGIRQRMNQTPCACVLASSTGEKAALLAAATDDAIAAGFDAAQVIKAIAGAIAGHGGGKAAMAQAGGTNAQGIEDALAQARTLLNV